MSSDVGEDAECHAAKLLEVILLQFKGSVDHVSHWLCCVTHFYHFILFILHFTTELLKTFCIPVPTCALEVTGLLLEC